MTRTLCTFLVMVLAGPGTGHFAAQAPAPKPAAGNPVLVVETVKGTFQIEMYPGEAPKTVEHIVALAKRNFYNGHRIHRVVKGFVVQFGDPQSRDMTKRDRLGSMGSGRPVGVAEISPKRRHRVGAVALANLGDPRTGDSQMYITLANQPGLDGKFTVFGQVIAGMEVVQQLAVNDIVRRVTVK